MLALPYNGVSCSHWPGGGRGGSSGGIASTGRSHSGKSGAKSPGGGAGGPGGVPVVTVERHRDRSASPDADESYGGPVSEVSPMHGHAAGPAGTSPRTTSAASAPHHRPYVDTTGSAVAAVVCCDVHVHAAGVWCE